MRNLLRQHWGVLFLTAVAVSFIGVQMFTSMHRGRTETEILFADRMTEAHRILIDEYNQLHRGEVRVVPIDFPNADFTTNERKEVLARSLRGEGDDIDAFAVDPIWVERFARWAEPLDDYFSQSELDAITGETLESCYKDGRLVAIPFNQVRGILLYRDDLLGSLPGGKRMMQEVNNGITWEKFIQYGMSLHGSHPYYIFPAAEYEGLICVYTELLSGRQRNYFGLNGFNFETTKAQQAAQFLVDLVQQYKVSPEEVTSMTEVSSYDYFVKHHALFLHGWTSYDKDFPLTNAQKEHLKMAPLPHFSDGTEASTIGGWNLMVSRFSPKKQQAVAFVKFLLKRESQEIMYTRAGYFPVIKALYDEKEYQEKYPELHAMLRVLHSGVHRPSHEEYTRYSEILARNLSQAIRGSASVDEALRQATRAIQSEKITLPRGR